MVQQWRPKQTEKYPITRLDFFSDTPNVVEVTQILKSEKVPKYLSIGTLKSADSARFSTLWITYTYPMSHLPQLVQVCIWFETKFLLSPGAANLNVAFPPVFLMIEEFFQSQQTRCGRYRAAYIPAKLSQVNLNMRLRMSYLL